MMVMCENIIDEIGNLADDIVKTEEQIIQMGDDIGYMADCIVIFIDEGLEFMESFCPDTSVRELYGMEPTLSSKPASSFSLKSSEYCDSEIMKTIVTRAVLQNAV